MISLVSNEIIHHGWQAYSTYEAVSIYQWMREEAKLMKLLSLPAAEAQRLFTIGDTLVDLVEGLIPEHPQFCLNSGGQLRLLDKATLANAQAANQSYRDLITTIDESGPVGIEYIIDNLSEDESDAAQACDQVLRAWLAKFPMDKYAAVEEEQEKQVELYFHERWLDNVDQFLDKCARDALPEEVRQITVLETQLEDREEELDGFPEDVDNLCETAASYANLRAEISLIQEQLTTAKAIRDALDIDELKLTALTHVQIGAVIARVDQANWSSLLNYDQDDPAHVLTEAQLIALVFQAVDDLVARQYVALAQDASGKLHQHLTNRRFMQEEKRSNAEGSLRTQAVAHHGPHQLSASEIRDPSDRTLFINVATSTEGSNFCHIIIGAGLSAIERPPLEPCPPLELSESIQEFITAKQREEPAYQNRAKELFKQFRVGTLILPPEQMTTLANYGLHPSPIKPHSTTRFSFLRGKNPTGLDAHSSSASAAKQWSP